MRQTQQRKTITDGDDEEAYYEGAHMRMKMNKDEVNAKNNIKIATGEDEADNANEKVNAELADECASACEDEAEAEAEAAGTANYNNI